MRNLILVIFFALMCSSCNNSKEGDVLGYVEVNGEQLPKISFENIVGEPEEIGISEIINGFEVIPLESTEECLIEYAQQTAFYDDKILVSTQRFSGQEPHPAPVFMFTDKGEFIREVGKGGRGPGEHNGYLVISIRVSDSVQINFQDKIQLFDREGELLGEVKESMDLMGDSYSYDRDVFFSLGNICGYPAYPRDSVLMVFQNAAGEIVKRIPRPEYPPRNGRGYTPTGWGSSVYKNNNRWNIYVPSVDTLFTLESMKLVPRLVFDFGTLGQDHNEIVDPKRLLGQYIFELVAETENYWLFRNAEITKAEVREWKPGQWGGQFDMTREMVIINKKGGASRKMWIRDDIWLLADNRMINDWSDILDHNKLVYSLQASKIKTQIVEILKNPELGPEVRARLEDLDSRITENSNPVIFIYHLKEKFKI